MSSQRATRCDDVFESARLFFGFPDNRALIKRHQLSRAHYDASVDEHRFNIGSLPPRKRS